jgi:flagellar biosynthesis component FlhA
VTVLEALVDASAATRDPRELAAAVRRRIVPMHLMRRGLTRLEPLIVAPEFEAELQACLTDGALAPGARTALHVRMAAAQYAKSVHGERAALVCSSQLRPVLAELLRRFGLRLDVYAYGELPPSMKLEPAMVLSAFDGGE